MAKKDSKDKSAGKGARPLHMVKSVAGREAAPQDDGFEAVRVLARIATEFDLSEIEVGAGGQIRVCRGGGGYGAGAAASAAGSGATRSITLTPPVAADSAGPGTFISSPFVGTFYRAPSPEAPSFVERGQNVRKGQVVCIVEAMKLMNEIEAEADGKVEEILVKNGEHVEYGQHLIRLTPA
ncbi:MAG TPA: acetyl-CoA carboxylase biotin carboxyl carrier protein [Polyangia bacterium]|nr:acetyl-CoA carboxylase biotin carboxyl carrier protein [Polyangia bacterium]